MPTREIKLKSDKEQIFEHFSEGAQPPRSSFQGWLEPPSPHAVGAYGYTCFPSGAILEAWCQQPTNDRQRQQQKEMRRKDCRSKQSNGVQF